MNGDKMKKKLLIFLAFAISIGAIIAIIYAAIALNRQEKIEDSYLIELTYKELEEKINKKESFVLVFTQTQCAQCHEYKPILKRTLAKKKFYAYEVVLDNLSKQEKAKLNDIANVSGTPTTVFIVDGAEYSNMNRIVGNTTKDKIESRLKTMGYIK